MNLNPSEVVSVEEIGSLDGSPVRLISMIGGFFMALARLKNKAMEEVISAGSHPAIVKFNIKKQFPMFAPSMMKSEAGIDICLVEKHSHLLSEDLKKSGHDLYSIETGPVVEFHLTKFNKGLSKAEASVDNQELQFNKNSFSKEHVKFLSAAVVEKSMASKFKKVKMRK